MFAFLINRPVKGLGGRVFLSEAPSPPSFFLGDKAILKVRNLVKYIAYIPVYALHTTRSPPVSLTVKIHGPVLIHTGRGGEEVNQCEG
jgi:hypothetical protein